LALVDPRAALSQLAKLGARLIIQRAVEDEFDAWLGRRATSAGPPPTRGMRNGFRARTLQTAEGELEVETAQVREAAAPLVSRLFPRGTKLFGQGGIVRGRRARDRLVPRPLVQPNLWR
jgi:putative transposase